MRSSRVVLSLGSAIDVLVAVVLGTKPADIERPSIVIMVHLHVQRAAARVLAWLRDQLAAPLVVPRIGPGIGFPALLIVEGVGFAPFLHPSGVAGEAPSPPWRGRVRAPATFLAASALVSPQSYRVGLATAPHCFTRNILYHNNTS
jgi:hypothetical protein